MPDGVGIHTRPRNGLSLCAGGGGLDLGLMLAEPGFHTRCFVEIEEYPRDCLIAGMCAGYFAQAPIWDDIKTFDGRPWRGHIDTILAGYPCQPFSAAGQRKGADDERHLWPDVARIIGEILPRWIFLENVEGHLSLGLDTVLHDIHGLGYCAAAGLFSTEETGGSQVRKRVFIVGRTCGEHLRPVGRAGSEEISRARGSGITTNREDPRCSGENVDSALGPRCEGREQPGAHRQCAGASPYGSTPEPGRPWISPPFPADIDGWRAALDVAPDLAPALSYRHLRGVSDIMAQNIAAGIMGEAEAQFVLCRMAHALATRSRALRLLGNGVDPLAAGYAWRTLGLAHGLRPLDLAADHAGEFV